MPADKGEAIASLKAASTAKEAMKSAATRRPKAQVGGAA